MKAAASQASTTLEKVSTEFEAEVLADLQEGRADASTLVKSAMKEAADSAAKALESGERQAESLKRQITGAAELDARNAQLKALEAKVNEVFSEAMKEAVAVPHARHVKSLAGLIMEGVGVIGEKASVSCNSKDRKAVAEAIGKLGRKLKLTLDADPIDCAGGVVLASPDGSVRFDNTLESRLERLKPDLRKEVAGLLAGD